MTKTKFLLKIRCNNKQTSDKNKEKYSRGDYKLMQYQILQTNITRTTWQTVKRITNDILGVKGLGTSNYSSPGVGGWKNYFLVQGDHMVRAHVVLLIHYTKLSLIQPLLIFALPIHY